MSESLVDTLWICTDEDFPAYGKTGVVTHGEIDPETGGTNTICITYSDNTTDEMKYFRFIRRFKIIQDHRPIKDRYEPLRDAYHTKKAELDAIDVKIQILRIECRHDNMVEDKPCPECDHDINGWFCPKSPTKECDYYDPETDEFDEDCCIYCGKPEERK